MNKATRLADLYAASVQEYTKTPGEWKGLLSCVARFYKRSFDNAVLIYAQRPNATQLGTFDEWHDKRIGRSINRGAKSIAVIDMVNPNASIKYLFDFLDTNGSVQSYRNLQKQLWELEEQYRPEVMVRLHEKYSLPVNSIEACLYRLVEQRVREMLPACLEGFQVTDEGSPLYGMPEAAIKAEFSALVEESVAYTVFSKCGVSTEWSKGSFENIHNYNSLPLFMALGNFTVSIARPILREVYQEIQNIKNERSKIYEDRATDGLGVSTGKRRDAVSQTPDFDRHTDRPGISGTVRRTLEGLHDGGTSAPPLRTGGTGENQRDDFAGGKGNSTAEGGADTTSPSHAADAGNGRYDGTGGASRHDNKGSRGERDKRSGTENQVTPQSPPPTQPPADGNKPSAGGFFVVPPRTQGQAAGKGNAQEGRENNTLIDAVLCADDLTPDAAGWLKDIVGFYQENDNPELRAHVLRIFYRGMNRNYGTKDGMYRVRILADEEKLTILERGNSSSYTYEELAGRVEQLIRDGRYPFSGTGEQAGEQAGEPEKEKAPFAREEAGQKETGVVDSGEENAKNVDPENKNREDTEPEGIDKKEIGGEYTDLKSTDGTIKEKEGGSKRDTLPEENQAGQEPQGEYAPAGKILGRGRVDGRQISLFDREIQDGYEDVSGADGDAMLDGLAMSNEQAAVQGEAIPDTSSGQFQTKQPQVQPATDTQNYRFSESHHLYDGGPKTKCQNNIAAIRLLKELQAQSRMANAKEQITLAKFVGWGGLANALTPDKPGWENQYEDIKSLLTDEEFAAAQESTLTAYYTEQGIIRHIYDALSQFGFRGGNILDPAMATGNFFSVLPESMKNAKLYGVEIEPISGGIAKQLYPDADIQVAGFEHTPYPDQFFDLVIGNIPFNSIKVDDPKYNRYNFRIHDYFLAKSLDKLRPGGILAVITSKYTMDKANPTNRKYLAQRAELIGAIRLPNNAFRQVAGTEVTTDILFLQKREREIVPDENNSPWLSIEQHVDGIPINRYFTDHPEMVLGKMVFDESMYGNERTTACHPIPGDDLDERLGRAVSYLEGEYWEPEQGESATGDDVPTPEDMPLPAAPDVRNFSYTLVDNRLYYREHSKMYPQETAGKRAERIKGLVEITQTLRGLIDFQNQEQGTMPEAEYETALKAHIANLNTVYDHFVKAYGYINSSANVTAFSQDANAPLLRSIEKERKDEKGVYDKTAVFHRATIRPKKLPTVVFSAEEALKVSLNVKGRVDLEYMAGLYQKPDQRIATKEEIIAELGEQIYQNPVRYAGNPYAGWETAGEYLSGHVKDKLTEAILKAEEEPERFARNVEALKAVQPAPLTPAEIRFSLGTPWIPLEVYQDFMYETFKTQGWNRMGRNAVVLEYSKYSSTYFIANKGSEKKSVTVNQVYGTERMNAYEILEASLNLRFVEVRDKVEYTDPVTGEEKEKYVLNKKETIIAREKQAQLKAEFELWLFAEPERGASLTKLYNDRFNNLRPREYDGRELVLPDLAEGIKLRKHQLDVVAHGLYGEGNLLMAHEVGAGKTYAAIVLTHEMKRLGKANKPLIAVPNHLVGQWSDAYLELYPNANLLVAGKRDFEKQNRRRFVSRIATGDYDCIIMAHSSFERIGMSRERQLASMQRELDAVTEAIREQKARSGDGWSLKQMQIFRKNLQFRFDQLFHAAKKDDVINFEELGMDALVVDEAHAYKNNFSYTKMRNVAGISSQSSQRAMDMHQKCQYINEISGGRNVIYLTGTPVSNSMSELYVMQKTLQPQELERRGVLMFDEWAGTFGKVTSSLEIRPEGNGYQMKNRFSQFHNLPELMGMFALVADIRTADMLDLPTPKLKTGAPQIIKSTCTPEQKHIVMELAERAEEIRSGKVDSSQDNFLKLTHEARLLSTDPRAIDAAIADDPDTKLNQCARNVAKIYHETEGEKLTQIIFCDQGTPKYDGSFNFYEATKEALTRQGVKPEEIAFIHDAKTDMQREQLFEKVRKGETRILMGSTEKMGTGTNVQQKLVALHHLDVPWVRLEVA